MAHNDTQMQQDTNDDAAIAEDGMESDEEEVLTSGWSQNTDSQDIEVFTGRLFLWV